MPHLSKHLFSRQTEKCLLFQYHFLIFDFMKILYNLIEKANISVSLQPCKFKFYYNKICYLVSKYLLIFQIIPPTVNSRFKISRDNSYYI